MKEISLHILDIAENSISADAKNIEISVVENGKSDLLQITIKDDGKGMDDETIARIQDPFYTSRTTRRVGLGIPLFKAAAEACQGGLTITSTPGKGTEVIVVFQNSHIDRMPIGDLTGTILTLMIGSPEIHWKLIYAKDDKNFELDSRLIQKELGEVPLCDPAVMKWLREYIREGILDVQNA
ncbi:MAG: sensor histidine kinase [Chloroflexi bacterium]|nr:sensor histidine kinase [Chloroflexota bacterium]